MRAARAFSSSSSSSATTHFGSKTVASEVKEELVGEVFKNVASKYDVMNDAMSAGIHRYWKQSYVDMLAPQPGVSHLDLASGTGDISFKIIDSIRDSRQAQIARGATEFMQSHIVASDINEHMLKLAESRAKELGYTAAAGDADQQMGVADPSLTFLVANAEQLPYPAASFDSVTMAFGIRNVTNVGAVLREVFRVLKPGGRFLCLEFSHVDEPVIKEIYDAYSFNVIPALGQLIADDRESYQYLVESIRQFPSQQEFALMWKDAGFQGVTYDNFQWGVTAIHSGFRFD